MYRKTQEIFRDRIPSAFKSNTWARVKICGLTFLASVDNSHNEISQRQVTKQTLKRKMCLRSKRIWLLHCMECFYIFFS